jgi:hypothetical protein
VYHRACLSKISQLVMTHYYRVASVNRNVSSYLRYVRVWSLTAAEGVYLPDFERQSVGQFRLDSLSCICATALAHI